MARSDDSTRPGRDTDPGWAGMTHDDWRAAEPVLARLAAGADPRRPGAVPGEPDWTPLHAATRAGAPAGVLVALLRYGAEPDPADAEGCTPLWYAVCRNDEEGAAALLDGGADGWRPCLDGWSPGHLAMTLPALAPLFARLPGAVLPGAAERAAQAEADRLIDVMRAVEYTEGCGVAFVAGVTEDELIRRLGADPAGFPVLGPGSYPWDEPGDDDLDEDDEDDEDDADDEEEEGGDGGVGNWVGVSGVEGGCVVVQPAGFTPGSEDFLVRVSSGTTAYGVYFNPKGGTFGSLARDGEVVRREEIGLSPFAGDPPEFYRFRFWRTGAGAPYDAASLAYACAAAGVRPTDAEPLNRRPRRWVRMR